MTPEVKAAYQLRVLLLEQDCAGGHLSVQGVASELAAIDRRFGTDHATTYIPRRVGGRIVLEPRPRVWSPEGGEDSPATD